MPRVRFEPTSSVFWRKETFNALDCADTLIGIFITYLEKINSALNEIRLTLVIRFLIWKYVVTTDDR
jgi:hypothetical protein